MAEQDDKLAQELQAMELWEHHMQEATQRWKEGVQQSADDYRAGLAKAMGVDPDDVPDDAVEHWQEQVQETDQAAFTDAVREEGADWFLGMYERVTGEEPDENVKELAQEIDHELQGMDSDEEIADRVRTVLQRKRDERQDT